MGKYEVTQEEYASVMEGQKVIVEGVEYTLESDPTGASSGSYRVYRGGDWGISADYVCICRRSESSPYLGGGFRVVRPFPSTTE